MVNVIGSPQAAGVGGDATDSAGVRSRPGEETAGPLLWRQIMTSFEILGCPHSEDQPSRYSFSEMIGTVW
jgi:hypothetical protein